MFESIINFFKKVGKTETKETGGSKDKAKERLHLVLMQDRANVSADFLELMKQEIIDVIKKYIEVEEGEIDVRLTNEIKEDGTTGAPSLYANIPIVNIRNEMKKSETPAAKEEKEDKEEKKEPKKEKEEKAEEGEPKEKKEEAKKEKKELKVKKVENKEEEKPKKEKVSEGAK